MTQANMYNPNQFVADAILIADMLGEGVLCGFYAIHEYNKNGLNIRYPYISDPFITFNGVTLQNYDVPMDSPLAQLVLELALVAEDRHFGRMGFLPRRVA